MIGRKPKVYKQIPPPPVDMALAPDEAEVKAIQAIYYGKASEQQQKIFASWLQEIACGMNHSPYRGTDRDTAFALGRAFVWQQIVGVLKINVHATPTAKEK